MQKLSEVPWDQLTVGTRVFMMSGQYSSTPCVSEGEIQSLDPYGENSSLSHFMEVKWDKGGTYRAHHALCGHLTIKRNLCNVPWKELRIGDLIFNGERTGYISGMRIEQLCHEPHHGQRYCTW